MRLSLSRPTIPTLKRIARTALLVTAIYAFCGFLLLPLIIKPILKSQLQQVLHRPLTLAKVAVNPFTLSLTIKQLTVADHLPGRPLFSCDELVVDLELLSLCKLAPVLKEITVTGPALSVVRTAEQEFNFSDLIPRASEPVAAEPTRPPRFAIGAMAIHRGRISFSDQVVNQEQVVEGIELRVPYLSSLAADQEREVTPRVNAQVNSSPLTLNATLTPFAPKGTNSLQFTMRNADLTCLAPYLPTEWGLDLVSGRADSDLTLSFAQDPGQALALTLSGRLTLSDFDLTESDGAPLLTFPSFTLTMAPSALLRRELHFSKVALAQPGITLQRNADRTTNLGFLTPPPQEAVSPRQQGERTATPLQLTVDDVAVSGARVTITDHAVGAPFTTVLAPVDLALSGLSTQGEGEVDYLLTLTAEAGETLSVEGSATLSPVRSEGELALRRLSLPKYTPYVGEFLNFTLDSASLDLETEFRLAPGGSVPELALRDLGLTLRDLSCRRGEERPFVTVPLLSVQQGQLDLAGRTLSLGTINSQGGSVSGHRLEDGSMDLASLFRPVPAAKDQPSTTPWAIDVKSFAFTDYALRLSDAAHPETLDLSIGQLAIHGQGLQSRDAGVTLQELGCDLVDLSLGRAQGEPLLAIPSLAVAGVAVDQPGRAVTIEQISSHGGNVACTRQPGGDIDWATLLAPGGQVKPAEKQSAPTPPWDLALGQLALSGYRVAFVDQALTRPLSLDARDITLRVRELSTRERSMAQLEGDLAVAGQGHVAFTGQMGHDPLSVDLGLKATAIPVATFEPYWAERLKMQVSKGAFATDGRLTIRARDDQPLAIGYQGEVSVVDFLAMDGAGQKLLSWKSLTSDGLALEVSPVRLAISNVGLTDYFLSLVLNPEGQLNLRDLLVAEEKGEAPPSVKGSESTPTVSEGESDIAIGRITLQGGEIDFADRHIRPNFTTKLLEMTGRISGLASDQESRAEVDLFGKLANRAPITITGTMNPLAPELFVDLKGSLKDVELSSLTPYAGRYVGYTIRKGKLFLDTSYSIIGTKIDSQHSFLLDQFLLGDQVESSEAVKAPVKLAVALLKDRKGEIHFELPIRGDLSRPDFHIGAIAGKIFMGLITKAVTAPFALLGALFGGEELRMVEFAPGSVTILPESQKRLEALAKALKNRPALNLEIKGYASQDKDHEALVRQRYARLLLAGEDGGRVNGEEAVRQVNAMAPKEMEKRLSRAYKRADFPKPRNVLGFTKGLEAEEMRKLLLSHIEVSEDELLLLADERAQAVTDSLRGPLSVDPQRLTRLEPGVEPTRGEGKVTGSRVDFSLR